MGDGVTGSTNAPANQTTNAGRSGDSSQADTAAKAKFGEALSQESLCPPGLSRRPPEGCTYLRPPSQPPQPSKPIDINIHGDADRFKGPMNRSNGPDTSKPIPQSPPDSFKLPDFRPYHEGGPNGTHIIGVKGKF